MTLRDAYILGYYPQLIGIYFNSMLIFEKARPLAAADLEARIESLMAQSPSKATETVAYVRLVETALQSLGFTKISPPHLPEEYFLWAEQIMLKLQNLLTHYPHFSQEQQLLLDAKKWVYSFAMMLGDITHTLQLLALVHYLLGAGGTYSFLENQHTQLEASVPGMFHRLHLLQSQTIFVQGFSLEVRQSVHQGVEQLAAAFERTRDKEHDVQAAILQKELSSLVGIALERHFTIPGEPGMKLG